MSNGERLVGHANCFHGFPIDEAWQGFAAAGYTQIELSAPEGNIDIRADDAAVVQDRLATHGLEAVALSAHTDLTSAAGAAYTVRAIEWAANGGLRHLTTSIGGHGDPSKDLDGFLTSMAPVAEAATRHEVTVGLEIHGRLMASGQLSRSILALIESPFIGVKYDTGNCEYYGGVRAVDDFASIADRVVNVDVKDHVGGIGDWNFPPAGEGDIDWPKFGDLLHDQQYRGPLTVEIEFVNQTWPGYDEIVAALRTAKTTVREFLL